MVCAKRGTIVAAAVREETNVGMPSPFGTRALLDGSNAPSTSKARCPISRENSSASVSSSTGKGGGPAGVDEQAKASGNVSRWPAIHSRPRAAHVSCQGRRFRCLGFFGDLNMTLFARYMGIDYSAAETPNASLKGLRVYLAQGGAPPVEVPPPPSPRKYWTRRGIAEWLTERLAEPVPTLIGIDHGFSFPLRYFEVHGLKPDWSAFLDDFQRHWPTDENIYVDFVRDGTVGNGSARTGSSRWRRLTEERSGSAKSVFHFDVQGSVAKSTHAGIPWLRFIRQRLGERVHFWPFDGWDIPVGRSAIAEVYPRLWSRSFAAENRNSDQHDAYSIAAWLQRADHDGSLAAFLKPALTMSEQAVAQVEGWILGVRGTDLGAPLKIGNPAH